MAGRPSVVLATTHLLWNATLGGHAWVFLNWALGLQENGARITVLERAKRGSDPETVVDQVRTFRARMAELGLDLRVALMGSDEELDLLGEAHAVLGDALPTLNEVHATADVLLNFRYGLRSPVVDGFRRSLLVDIDPGLLQLWITSGHVTPTPHDAYVTIGETVGQPGARVSDCGLSWHHTPPPLYLPAWPVTRAGNHAPYTTVTNWWGEYEIIDGDNVNNEKRTEFVENYLDLPARTAATLELAIYHEPGHPSDMPMMEENGWRTRPAREVSASPSEYRRYIQSSRGEFSCAKRSCMAFENAWISDRTLCYLASGKPAIVQHTGESRLLPDHSGLLRFRSADEAAAMLTEVEAHYDDHAAAARALVEEKFDAVEVTRAVLEHAMDIPPRQVSRDRV
ncbi:MAG: hypothetical protein CMJ83_06625 [Planctomycetes bacterium]|nr:hypothetical protein [Planctomycetota bacterium]